MSATKQVSEEVARKRNRETADSESAEILLETSEMPKVKWEDVCGLDDAKRTLMEAISTKVPERFNSILLFGPPGTGKTRLAKAVATFDSSWTFLHVSATEFATEFGKKGGLVRSLFKKARELKPTVFFVDDIEWLRENVESACRATSEFVDEMQEADVDNESILVIGATNVPWMLESKIRKLFKTRIKIPLPDNIARTALFKGQLAATPNSLQEGDFRELGKKTEGFTGADIIIVVRDALMEPVRQIQTASHFCMDSTGRYSPCSPGVSGAKEMNWMDIPGDKLKDSPITMKDFLNSLKTAKPSVAKEDWEQFRLFREDFGQEG